MTDTAAGKTTRAKAAPAKDATLTAEQAAKILESVEALNGRLDTIDNNILQVQQVATEAHEMGYKTAEALRSSSSQDFREKMDDLKNDKAASDDTIPQAEPGFLDGVKANWKKITIGLLGAGVVAGAAYGGKKVLDRRAQEETPLLDDQVQDGELKA